jgi:quercetin dioxygenase-like cupin family protein
VSVPEEMENASGETREIDACERQPVARSSPSSANETEELDVTTTGQSATTATQAQVPGIERTDLQHYDLSAPGREMIQNRVVISPEAQPIRHKHPGEEIIYVLEGSLEYEVEGKPPVTLTAGEVLFIPAGTIHAAKNVGSGNASELATYVVEKDKPLLTLVK